MSTSRGYMPRSKRDDWETPPHVFDFLWDTFGPFDLDPATSIDCYSSLRILEHGGNIFTEEEDGLSQPWFSDKGVFLNPPHSQVEAWVKKAVHETVANRAVSVCALLPARTDTKWFHDYVLQHASVVCFLRGRITFGGAAHPAPFPSIVVLFGSPRSSAEAKMKGYVKLTSPILYYSLRIPRPGRGEAPPET